ncbi:DUF397 domain-containing protein [Streptomyces sp. NPDC006798]|uniref:DUF397 domain-containing protein n=1 Tax=Streptomyces sp. NPDC006798 TaxID=3155462 RepID=UPI0033DD1E82
MAIRKERVTRTHVGQPFLFSSESAAGDDCVGVAGACHATADGTVAVLDSKRADGPLIVTTRQPWRAFMGWVAGGQ